MIPKIISKELNQENRYKLSIIIKAFNNSVTPDIFSPQLRKVKYTRLAVALLLAQNAKR
jgi:hypothetical protein